MSEVISPTAGQTVVTTDNGHRHGHDGNRHPDRWDLAVEGKRDATAVAKAIADMNYQVQIDASKNAAAISVQNQKESDGLTNQATNFFNLAAVQAQTIASAAALTAQQLASTAAAQAAECCCEIKSLILADGAKTRDLVTAIQMQDLRDSRTKLEVAYAALFTAKVVPVAPVV